MASLYSLLERESQLNKEEVLSAHISFSTLLHCIFHKVKRSALLFLWLAQERKTRHLITLNTWHLSHVIGTHHRHSSRGHLWDSSATLACKSIGNSSLPVSHLHLFHLHHHHLLLVCELHLLHLVVRIGRACLSGIGAARCTQAEKWVKRLSCRRGWSCWCFCWRRWWRWFYIGIHETESRSGCCWRQGSRRLKLK